VLKVLDFYHPIASILFAALIFFVAIPVACLVAGRQYFASRLTQNDDAAIEFLPTAKVLLS
jgi:hypothetical protein